MRFIAKVFKIVAAVLIGIFAFMHATEPLLGWGTAIFMDPPSNRWRAMKLFNTLRNEGYVLDSTCEKYGGFSVHGDYHSTVREMSTPVGPEAYTEWGSSVDGILFQLPDENYGVFYIPYAGRQIGVISLLFAPMYSLGICEFTFSEENT